MKLPPELIHWPATAKSTLALTSWLSGILQWSRHLAERARGRKNIDIGPSKRSSGSEEAALKKEKQIERWR